MNAGAIPARTTKMLTYFKYGEGHYRILRFKLALFNHHKTRWGAEITYWKSRGVTNKFKVLYLYIKHLWK